MKREGTGYQTALTALQRLKEMTASTPYPVDHLRLFFAGHSRYYYYYNLLLLN